MSRGGKGGGSNGSNRNYDGCYTKFNGSSYQKGLVPFQTWRVCFYPYNENGVPNFSNPSVTLDSETSTKAALLDLQGTVDRTNQINTMNLTIDDTGFKITKLFKKDQAVLIWIGYKDYMEFNDDNFIFGGFVSDYDNLNVIDQKLKVTVSAFERALVFNKYKLTTSYDCMELGSLMSSLLSDAGFPGSLDYTNTGVTAVSFACMHRRLSECVNEVVNALDSYIQTTDPTKAWLPLPAGACGTCAASSASSSLSSTDKAGASSLGQLYGTPNAYRWDFWVDKDLVPHFHPLFKKSKQGRAYRFYYGNNLLGYERQKKAEFDVTPAAHDSYTMEVPMLPDINVFDNNVISTGADDNTLGIDGMKYRVDQIDYTLPGSSMKLTATKWQDTFDKPEKDQSSG